MRPVGPSQSRSFPSAHQQALSRSYSSGSNPATVKQTSYGQRSSSPGQQLPSSQRGGGQSQDHYRKQATSSNNTGARVSQSYR